MSLPSRQQLKKKGRGALLWPAMGFKRLSLYYKHRLCRLPGTPYFIAAGFATGIAVSFTPFMGLHLLLGAVIAFFLRGSLLAMAFGTILGNPWTFPLIWLMTYKLGAALLGLSTHGAYTGAEAFTFSMLLDKPLELLLPMTLGAAPFFAVSWIVSFHLCRNLVKKYKDLRQARILRKRS